MSKHPNALPDVVARKLTDLAREHGYGIEDLSLSWLTDDIGPPATARVRYSASNDDVDPPLVTLRVEDPKVWELVKAMADDVRTRGVMPLAQRTTKENDT